jgi:hypothetical protein
MGTLTKMTQDGASNNTRTQSRVQKVKKSSAKYGTIPNMHIYSNNSFVLCLFFGRVSGKETLKEKGRISFLASHHSTNNQKSVSEAVV